MAGAAQGGAETAFVDMCLALKAEGVEVTAAIRPHAARAATLTASGIPVHSFPFGGAFDFRTKRGLRRLIDTARPQVVQTWMGRAARHTPGWRQGDKTPRYTVIARLGGYYALKQFRSSDAFVTITPDIRRYLLENGVAPGRVRHINNFAEVETASAPADRAALDTPADAPLLLALGRLHRAKALDILLQAMTEVPDAYLWIAGEGPERAALTAQCDGLGLRNRVRFLGWRDDRAALLQACDICVFPSRYEPFGTVFVQAWAQGRPVVAALSDGPRQYIKDGEDGLLVPVDDAAALAAALNRLIGDPALRVRLAQAGGRRFVDGFTRNEIVRQYLSFYGEVTRLVSVPS